MKILSLSCIIFLVLTNYCLPNDLIEKVELSFKQDCFIDKNFVQLQGLASVNNHQNFIYLQCEGKKCKYAEINLTNNEVKESSVSHLNFQATHVSNLEKRWKMTWDRDQGKGDVWEIEWDKAIGKVAIKQIFKKVLSFRPKDLVDISTIECKKESKSQDKLLNAQEVMAKSGITLDQCETLRDKLKLDSGVCGQLAAEFEPYLIRAEQLRYKLPLKNRATYSAPKAARILKEFPETTDEWMVEQLKNEVDKTK